ncbi:D-serine ammonia-lyase [Celerinatantimonas sp. MCCC 1A17872]|uniref:D-serine ammonia-lyase n=1 Tax=Celerinatantimonas sp. MCCC 1A17872 TaxID=3177514 RepID=UPI0038C06C41
MSRSYLGDDCLQYLKQRQSFLWLNPNYQNRSSAPLKPDESRLYEASERLLRLAPLLKTLFGELESSGGIIESTLTYIKALNQAIDSPPGDLFLKNDHQLPVAGSIKARGGIYEVLCFAERLALENGIIENIDDDYNKLADSHARELFSRYRIIVGSTGNLGLSIGLISSALGFSVTVHMSVDAKEWKKQRLRENGVNVVEHANEYSNAVAAGREQASRDPFAYFIDDENSPLLFMGYAVAALRLKNQLEEAGRKVDEQHPLFVYLPAGVGGAPGGITFGLKAIFGANAHCFWAEPVESPCCLMGLATAASDSLPSVSQLQLTNRTDADGLAVGCASHWVCNAVRDGVSGVYTATDDELYQKLKQLHDLAQTDVEPSAAISLLGPKLLSSPTGVRYCDEHQLSEYMSNATHIAWLTGGALVPDDEYSNYLSLAEKFTK